MHADVTGTLKSNKYRDGCFADYRPLRADTSRQMSANIIHKLTRYVCVSLDDMPIISQIRRPWKCSGFSLAQPPRVASRSRSR